ncbi:cytochrome d ubiquinol oxidase subunit II [Halodesulfovibrio sp. MK-HDV]|jgi:cytochrome bd ubiquinol oxidase subunit II|uniref:cytochrome d ubiquinol oxidase subunit II n=1 Tax=unclassified Halodesulfovibrio TaxID=2644657 RepID=UPI00136CA7CD|nr:cytochrome d ubiquinol oxidase subunit II [Halodesulfovibrio sp. MK-HDV]KAF1074438.1 Cytochrome bd-I ubiquinol oxidase subunit 2 [Halodesulfovibrio sp. MK-HDV]
MTLELIWFLLWGVLWAVYFVLDGYDLGLGTIFPFFAKSEREKRVLYNAVAPFWDGNEVWLIAAGGITFAAFPRAYAIMFSALYAPLFIILFALIMRAASFEFRSKVDSDGWRKMWDVFQFLGNFVPALLFGVAFANIFQGIPFDADGVYYGSILKLLNVYGIIGGLFFVINFSMHGSLWLSMKSDGEIHDRAIVYAKRLWPFTVALAVAFLAATGFYTDLFVNYQKNGMLLVVPAIGVTALLMVRIFLAGGRNHLAWISNAISIFFVIMFGIIGMFPKLLPSSLDPAASVTIFNGASSTLTLQIMLGVVAVIIPLVLLYQLWAVKLLMHVVDDEVLDSDESY